MAVPYVGNVLNGWCRNQTVYLVDQSVDQHGNTIKVAIPIVKKMMLQAMPSEDLKEIPQESRSDGWWRILIKERDLSLNMNDIIFVNYAGRLRGFQIKKRGNWGQYGYCRYDALEYEGKMPEVQNA